MSIRLAIGAQPKRIIRQLITESLLLAGIGGGLGCLLAVAGRGLFLSLMPPTYLPIAIQFPFNIWILGVVLMVTLVVGIVFGFAPALQCARANLQLVMKEGARGVVRSTHHYLRAAFVVGEVALATVLLVGMGLCLRSLEKSRRVDVGLDPNNVYVAGFRIGPNDGDEACVQGFYRRLRTSAAELPGATAVGMADWLPLGFEGGSSSTVKVPGYIPAPGESMDIGISKVSPGYFSALRIPIKDGRAFAERDDTTQPFAVIVNEEFAKRYFARRDPVGLKIHFWGRDGTVVGVAGNGKYRQLNESQRPWIYANQLQASSRTLTLVVRSTAPVPVLARSVDELARRIDPTLPPIAALSYSDFVGAAWAVPRMASWLMSFLGVVACFLAVLGVYAVVNQQATRRTREIAIRMALGAPRFQIFKTVLLGGLVLALIGLGLGCLAGLALGRALGSMLIETGPGDWAAWLGMMLTLLITVLFACWLPAWRAAKVDPMEALRCE